MNPVDSVAFGDPFHRLHALKSPSPPLTHESHEYSFGLVIGMMCHQQYIYVLVSAQSPQGLVSKFAGFGFKARFFASLVTSSSGPKNVEALGPCERNDGRVYVDYKLSAAYLEIDVETAYASNEVAPRPILPLPCSQAELCGQ